MVLGFGNSSAAENETSNCWLHMVCQSDHVF